MEKSIDIAKQLEKDEKTLESEVKAIIPLDLLAMEIEIKRIAKEFDVRKTIIDQYIKEFVKKEQEGGSPDVVTGVEPFEEEVDGANLLDSISAELLKYVILPSGAAIAIAVWIVLTYFLNAFRIFPILGITSPIKRCGKTTLLEVLQGLTNKGLTASNISPAAVFRTIDKYHPTLLIDEADTFLKDNDELRGVLNSGHTKTTAFVIRVEGESLEPVKFSTWGPKAISMIGSLPETLQDRSVVIKLRRKMPDERAAKLDIDFEAECIDIRRKCQRWADDNLNKLTLTRPEMPTTNNDRMADNWMPLFAIAHIAGGDWPELIKKSMSKMMSGEDDNIGVMLLEDIRDIFNSTERMFSSDLVDALKEKLDRPWDDWNRGKGLTQNGLGRLLKPFGVTSKTMRIAEDRKKGYELNGFKDVFRRYLPTPPVSSVTTGQVNNINNLDVNQSVTNKISITDEKQANQLKLQGCHAVTDEKGGIEGKSEIPEWKRFHFKTEEHYQRIFD